MNSLLRLAAYYQLKPGEDRTDIDSAFVLTRQADMMACRIGFRRGSEQAAFQDCRIRVEINDTLSLQRLLPSLSDSNRVKVLLVWGTHYLLTSPEAQKANILRFCAASQKISVSEQNGRVICMTRQLLALADLTFDSLEKGRSYANQSLQFLDSTGDFTSAVQFCDYIRMCAHKYPTMALAKFSYEYPLKLAVRAGDSLRAAECFRKGQWIADFRRENRLAAQLGQQALRLGIRYSDSMRFELYLNTIREFVRSGDFYHALLDCHEAIPLMKTGSSPNECYYLWYYSLEDIYLTMSRLSSCIDLCKKGIADTERSLALRGRSENWVKSARAFQVIMTRDEALALCREGYPRQAIELIEGYERRTNLSGVDISTLPMTEGECYLNLKDYASAERYFAQSLDKSLNPIQGDSLRILLPLAQLFLEKGNPKKAAESLQKFLHAQSYIVSPYRLRTIYYLLYRADSASGDLKSALYHLRAYKDLNDSLFSLDKNAQFEDQQLQFATKAKDLDMKTQAQHIQLLQKEQELQKTQLRDARLIRNMMMAGALLSLIVLIVLYNRYLLKRRSDREKARLLVEKDDLIVEKEWLLQELHHRVKNNLQLVVSLLSMASRSIDNEAAKPFIRESEHRIHAMSLIHQKLYREDGTLSVEMDDYVRELVAHLDDNYNEARRVKFVLELEKVIVDASIAVPIGLILNEAITNTMKHAFPGTSRGTVRVAISDAKLSLLLTIADDGIGLSPDFRENQKRSMGLSLMKALTKQIHGSFEMRSQQGVTIDVKFPCGRV